MLAHDESMTHKLLHASCRIGPNYKQGKALISSRAPVEGIQINADVLTMAQSWQKSCPSTASMGPTRMLHMCRKIYFHWPIKFTRQQKQFYSRRQRGSISAAPMKITGATDAVQLCLLIGIFRRQIPGSISHGHCCSIVCLFLLLEPTTHHAIQHRHLYIRRCACLHYSKNYLHSYPAC